MPDTTYEQVQRLVALGTWEWDLAADRVTWSAELYRLMGVVPGGELSLGTYIERLHPEDRRLTQERIEETLENGAPFVRDQRIVRADDGKVRWMRATGELRTDELGNPTSMFGTCQDVTDLKALQRQLVTASRSDDIGLLVAGLGHDLNNLLWLVQAEAERLEPDSTKQPAIDRIRLAIVHASKLTRKLLDLGSGDGLGSLVRVDVREALLNAMPLLRRLGCEVQLSLETGGGQERVMLAAGDFERMLLNLVRNAAAASEADSVVRLGLRQVTVAGALDDAGPGPYVVVSVHDSGSGMAEDLLERVFEPRFTSKAEGGGFGLTIVKTIVGEAGGFIRVTSEVGKGTRFDVFLPRVP